MTTQMIAALLCIASLLAIEGFVIPSRKAAAMQRLATELFFGLPSFGPKDEKEEVDPNLEKNKIGLKGLVQLITAGAGAPFLGDFQGVDKETGKFMFSLEANNLVDENGESKQTKMPFFEQGWVDPEDAAKEQQRKENGFKFPWQK